MSDTTKFKTARELADMSQETAAEKLYVSVHTVRRIERGTQPCGKDIAEAMAVLYKAPWVADPTVPNDYRPKTLLEATMRFIKERKHVDNLMDLAVDILGDGQVDETEKEDFQNFVGHLGHERDAERDLLYAR